MARPFGRGFTRTRRALARPLSVGKDASSAKSTRPFSIRLCRASDLGDAAAARRRGTDTLRGADRLPACARLRGNDAPALHIRVQELFGLKPHPAIARGRLPLTLYLLSPSHRPIQITRDLPGFWSGSWAAVRSDMRGQYPKHVWPDDPAHAAPTARAKPRGT